MSELYVYYRIAQDQQAAALAQVQQVFQRLCQDHPGLRARLLQQPPRDGSPEQTWMEVYTHATGVDARLQAHIEAAAGPGPTGRLGARHLERFEPLLETGPR